MQRRTFSMAALATAGLGIAHRQALATDFPARPVKFVVSWSPGGGADSLARHLAKGLTERWGQGVVVENKPGGDATIGIHSMLQQPADGHTFGLIITSHAVHPSLRKAMPYDLLKDFTAVTNVVEAPNLLVVNSKLPVKSVQELIELGRTRPLNFAAPGAGGPGHLGGVMFNTATGLNALHVPYPGGAPALMSLVRGDTDFMFATLLSSLPLAKSGQIRALAITSKERSALYPELPTMAEAGVKNFELVTWYAIIARAGTPKAIIDKLAADINAVARDPKLGEQFTKEGVQVLASGPDRFAPYLSAEVRKWADIVKAGNIQPQ